MRRFSVATAGLVLFALTPRLGAQPAAARPAELIVCYPGGPLEPARALPALEQLLEVLGRLGGGSVQALRPRFTSSAGECRAWLKQSRPALLMVSLGSFLELRREHHLLPLVQPRIRGQVSERWRVLVRRSDPATSLAGLQGRTLGGTPLQEPELLRRVVLPAGTDPARCFRPVPAEPPLRTLRRLVRGELDGVLVDEQQYQALQALPFAGELKTVFVSEPLPLLGLAADESRTSPQQRSRLVAALGELCRDTRGRELCELFGVEDFVPADPAVFGPLIERWEAGR